LESTKTSNQNSKNLQANNTLWPKKTQQSQHPRKENKPKNSHSPEAKNNQKYQKKIEPLPALRNIIDLTLNSHKQRLCRVSTIILF
jgi:ribosomal protein S30